MGILYKSNGSSQKSREFVKEFLRGKKKNGEYRVLDLGGAANPWCEEFVDVYVDLYPVDGKETILGNFFDDNLWIKIRKFRPDFIICTHVLEDVRDPLYLLKNILESAQTGYISVPNKHTELSTIESRFYVGYCHHRWIFTLHDETLFAVAKFPVTSYFSSSNTAWQFILSQPLFKKILDKFFPLWPGGRALDWVEPNLAKGSNELGILFDGNLSFSYLNGDFAGQSYLELAELYRKNLRNGI